MENAISTLVKVYLKSSKGKENLGKKDFQNLVKSQLGNILSDADSKDSINNMAASLDENQDGKLGFPEYMKLIGYLATSLSEQRAAEPAQNATGQVANNSPDKEGKTEANAEVKVEPKADGAGGAASAGFKVEVPKVEVPKVEGGTVELPTVVGPKVTLEGPKVSVEGPKVEVPKVEVPKVDVPKVDVPKVDLSKVEVPTVDIEGPKVEVEVPKVEVEVPKVEVEVPKVDVPKVDLSKVEVPKVDLSNVEVPKVELPSVEVSKAEGETPKVSADFSSITTVVSEGVSGGVAGVTGMLDDVKEKAKEGATDMMAKAEGALASVGNTGITIS